MCVTMKFENGTQIKLLLSSFFIEWEHRMGIFCPFSSLYPKEKGEEGTDDQ